MPRRTRSWAAGGEIQPFVVKFLQAFDLSHLAADFESEEFVDVDELFSWSWIEFASTPLCNNIPMARARQLHRCFAHGSARTAALDKLKQARGVSATTMTQKPSQSRNGEVVSAPAPRVPMECLQGDLPPSKRAKTSAPSEGSCVEVMLQDVPPGCSLKKCPSVFIQFYSNLRIPINNQHTHPQRFSNKRITSRTNDER